MEIRCASCHGIVEDAIAEREGGATCASCRRRQALVGAQRLGATKEERARRAMEYAEEHGVSLASAYLALLGIQQAAAAPVAAPAHVEIDSRETSDAEQSEAPEEPDETEKPPALDATAEVADIKEAPATATAVAVAGAEPAEATREIEDAGDTDDTESLATKIARYDPDFREAVEKGFLTPRQAFERGNRTTYAAKLAQRYGLQMDVALLLADNRIQVDDAIDVEEATAPWHYEQVLRPGSDESSILIRIRPSAAVVTLILGALCGWVVWANGPWSQGPASVGRTGAGFRASLGPLGKAASAEGSEKAALWESPATSRVEFVADNFGALTRVSGPDPASVLEAFCSYPQNRERFALETVTSGVVPSSVERLGVLRDRERGGSVGLVVSRDPRTRRWQIGSGRGPITVLDNLPSR